MGRNPRIRQRGSRLWDPETCPVAARHVRWSGGTDAVTFPHGSSKSSCTATRVVFCPRAASSMDKFFAARMGSRSPNLACGLCGRDRRRTAFLPCVPSVFLPLEPGTVRDPSQAGKDSCHGMNPGPAPKCRARIPRAWDDLDGTHREHPSECEHFIDAEAHRNRIGPLLPNLLTFQRTWNPVKAHRSGGAQV